MRGRFVVAVAAVGLLALGGAAPALASEVPAHPDQLEYPELDFQVPKTEEHRHTLPNGIVAYVAEDPALPLVDIGVRVKVGSFLDPPSQVGLANLTGALLSRGGAGDFSAEELDERVEDLAADLRTATSDTSGSASINCLSSTLEDCLDVLFDVLKRPRLEADRLELEKDNLLEQLKQRNDNPAQISRREWEWLLYGNEHFATRHVTSESLDAISRDDLVSFHRDYWRPESMVVVASGDFETEKLLELLAKHFADWPEGGDKELVWPPPKPRHVPQPGVYVVDKDIPQGRVSIGHLTQGRDEWSNPEHFALAVMNDILGGGGFTSRLLGRIRSDEGLAYSAFSSYSLGTYWPGTFRMGYQSKSETVALAAKIALEEMERIRTELVTDEELNTAKLSFIDTFPRSFDSARTTVSFFANDHFVGRPDDYWQKYRKRVEAVTKEDVLAVAKKYLKPEDVVFLIVGAWDEIEDGDADARASMAEFFGGEMRLLPVRDPLTLEPVSSSSGDAPQP